MPSLSFTASNNILPSSGSVTVTVTPSAALTDTVTLTATFLAIGTPSNLGTVAQSTTTAAAAAGVAVTTTLTFTSSSTPQTATYTPTQAGFLTLTLTDTAGYYSGSALTIACGVIATGTRLTSGGYQIFSAFVNDAGTTALMVVPGVTGRRIVVLSYLLSTGANAASITFSSSGGSAVAATKTMAADSSIVRHPCDFGYMATAPGEGLVLTATAAGVGLDVTFAVA
jgi:hypothetical protein